MKSALGAADAPLVKPPTDNLEAYNLVLQGRYHHMTMTAPALAKAVEDYTNAIALEPTYAQAHAGLAQAQVGRSSLLLAPSRETMPKAKESALMALALDDTVADAHTALAFVFHNYEWDWSGAEREYRRALELGSEDTFARSNYSFMLAQTGRADQSVAEARAVVEREPIASVYRYMLVMALILSSRLLKNSAKWDRQIDPVVLRCSQH